MSLSGQVQQNMAMASACRQHVYFRPLQARHRVLCAAAIGHQRQPHRQTQRCRAEERSRDRLKTQESEQIVVPDTPPAKDSSRSADRASSSQQSGEISEELKMLQQRKRDSQAAAPSNYAEAVLQEVRLIEWPKPKQAVLNTVLVIGIVGAATVFLLVLNSLLAETSKLAYR